MTFKNRPRITLEKTELDRIVDLLALVLIALHIVYVAISFKDLPETIATHFNGQGVADGWGSKSFLWVLPGVSLVTYIALAVLSKYPHIYNYLVEITEENAERQYRIAVHMIRYINLIVLVLFFYISYISITSSTGSGNTENMKYVIPLIIGAMFIFIGYFLVKSFKSK